MVEHFPKSKNPPSLKLWGTSPPVQKTSTPACRFTCLPTGRPADRRAGRVRIGNLVEVRRVELLSEKVLAQVTTSVSSI